jgi:hypothetical protein
MIDKEGTLQMQSSGRWAICRPGFDPIEITSRDVFRIEVPGEAGLRRTRMEHMDGEGYYSARRAADLVAAKRARNVCPRPYCIRKRLSPSRPIVAASAALPSSSTRTSAAIVPVKGKWVMKTSSSGSKRI